ncbi:hypothetical protein [Streptomyces sp. NBC_00847]|uniref:hypothetical protein n=1 Tax=Streptomyces sp. NBC_00847 TaxID=2975850 RepID=UPI00225ADCDE|nr:hypothetical protein [Streptomyces sp. NBC_00847]MCX4881700.1 hypothetical protein [Streptomyces sp. NBC_00847]
MRDVVRDVVADVASDELPLVDGLFRFDDRTAVRRLSGRGRRREPLGFGWGEVVVLVTPVVWLTVDQVAKRVGEVIAEDAARGTRAVVRRVFRRRPAPVVVPPLTREQMAQVRKDVLQAAGERGMSERRAKEIADAVVTRLVLAEASDPPRDRDAPTDGSAPVQG